MVFQLVSEVQTLSEERVRFFDQLGLLRACYSGTRVWPMPWVFLTNWVCSEPAIQAPGFGQCPGRRKVSTTTLIHDEVFKYELWNQQVSTTRFVHDEVGKCEIAIGQRVATGWGAIAKFQKKTCDTTILSSENARMLKVKLK